MLSPLLFHEVKIDKGGFRDLQEPMTVVLSGRYDPRLYSSEERGQIIGDATLGGWTPQWLDRGEWWE
jgi:hypothetical protein